MEEDFIKKVKVLDGFMNEVLSSKSEKDEKEAQEILKFLGQVSQYRIQNIETEINRISIELDDDEYIVICYLCNEYVIDIKKKDGSELSSMENPFLKGYAEYLYKKLKKALRGELPLLPDNSWKKL